MAEAASSVLSDPEEAAKYDGWLKSYKKRQVQVAVGEQEEERRKKLRQKTSRMSVQDTCAGLRVQDTMRWAGLGAAAQAPAVPPGSAEPGKRQKAC
eukprot:253301-Alexandrium_andersonii.AAC.1